MSGQGHVLVADDEDLFRESTCRLFQHEGFECHGASTGERAVELLRSERFDLLVSDIRMPQNKNLSVVEAARTINPLMAVILVTGYPSLDTAIRSVNLPVVAYLTKPVDFDEMLEHALPAIAFSQARERLESIKRRLNTCCADLETTSQRRHETLRDDLSLGTIRTLASVLSDLIELHAGLHGQEQSPNLCEYLDCTMRAAHREAILKTIGVLRRTKDTFKSKAIGELRAELEDLVGIGKKNYCRTA